MKEINTAKPNESLPIGLAVRIIVSHYFNI